MRQVGLLWIKEQHQEQIDWMYREARCESHCAIVAGDYISNDRDCRLLGHVIYGAGEAIGAPLSLAKKARNLADLVWLCRAPERDPWLARDGDKEFSESRERWIRASVLW